MGFLIYYTQQHDSVEPYSRGKNPMTSGVPSLRFTYTQTVQIQGITAVVQLSSR
jgi:hypothetical protein